MRVVLNTGFDRLLTTHLLGVLGWTSLADAVVCGDEVAEGRPAPDLILRAMALAGIAEARTVANVGDTTLDLAWVQIVDLEGRTLAAIDLEKGRDPKLGEDLFGVTRAGRRLTRLRPGAAATPPAGPRAGPSA